MSQIKLNHFARDCRECIYCIDDVSFFRIFSGKKENTKGQKILKAYHVNTLNERSKSVGEGFR
ncbi:hypothetical protein [Legionella steelei]|uniref:hypothetical protein n=1 Tax=Legionella steelei TaxID=947033 RepID=UPI0007319EC3|nr:hypothetical protein [Legionella steelei]MBN9226963.1 hypothetical protein [Legionella steelei]OJW14158.1 MAG: hypothetical protein BGO44_09430 [Legionella sp. 39-23]